jgi:hypothetical protein
MGPLPPPGKPRRVAIAVRTWAAEECVAVWNWASKYFIRVCSAFKCFSFKDACWTLIKSAHNLHVLQYLGS